MSATPVMQQSGLRREIPINAALRDALSGIVRPLDMPYVFCDANGKMYKGGRNAFERALTWWRCSRWRGKRRFGSGRMA